MQFVNYDSPAWWDGRVGYPSASGASATPPGAIGRVSHKRFAPAPGGVAEVPEFPIEVYDTIAAVLEREAAASLVETAGGAA